MDKQLVGRCTAVAALTLTLVACEVGTGGVSGNLVFRDRTESVPVDLTGRVDRPLAVGATLALQVGEGTSGRDADLVAASSSSPNVARIESFSLGRLVVRGVAPGQSLLHVTTRGGVEDSLPLSVAAIARTEILLLPWDPLLQLPSSLWSEGAVVLPDTRVDVFARHRDAPGTILTGHGAATWSLTDGVDVTLTPREGTDFATLRTGASLDRYTLSTSAGAELALETVAESAVARLALLVHGHDSPPVEGGATLQLEGGVTHLFHVAAFTQDGRYVLGAGAEAITVEVPEAETEVFRVTDAPSGSGAELDRALTNGRAFLARLGRPGTAEVTVRWAGLSATISVQVLPGAE
jgi:hypothetical protein